MTFAEMKTEVRRRLNETTSTFWTDNDIKEALNDGLEEISDVTEWYERQATIPLSERRHYYDLTSLLPDTFLAFRRCWNTETQKWLTPTDLRELDYHTFRQWERTEGTPQKYYLRALWWLGVFPKPTRDGLLRLNCVGLPDAMNDSADEPQFPRELHYGIVEYALSDLLSQERETAKALSHWTEYLKYQTGLADFVNGRQSVARVSVL